MRNVDILRRPFAVTGFAQNLGGMREEEALVAPAYSSHLLVINADLDEAAAIARMATALGHQASTCATSTEALQLVARDSSIGIVIAHAHAMPFDGLWLARELSDRFALTRPISVIISASEHSEDALLAGLRANVADFLVGDLTLKKVSESIGRALARWSTKAHLLRLNAVLDAREVKPADNDHEPVQQDTHLALARSYAKVRRTRSKFFEPWVLASPTWDILLELALAALQDEVVSVSSICALSEFPMSTALRHVRQLETAGMISRELDAGDRRRCLLKIEPDTLATMRRYFDAAKV